MGDSQASANARATLIIESSGQACDHEIDRDLLRRQVSQALDTTQRLHQFLPAGTTKRFHLLFGQRHMASFDTEEEMTAYEAEAGGLLLTKCVVLPDDVRLGGPSGPPGAFEQKEV